MMQQVERHLSFMLTSESAVHFTNLRQFRIKFRLPETYDINEKQHYAAMANLVVSLLSDTKLAAFDHACVDEHCDIYIHVERRSIGMVNHFTFATTSPNHDCISIACEVAHRKPSGIKGKSWYIEFASQIIIALRELAASCGNMLLLSACVKALRNDVQVPNECESSAPTCEAKPMQQLDNKHFTYAMSVDGLNKRLRHDISVLINSGATAVVAIRFIGHGLKAALLK